jgi:hypothetical protein
MKGTQRRLQCPKCGKGFFAWRPDELPGAPVKCYFCGTQFEDDAAKRKPAASPVAAPTPPAQEVAPTPPPAAAAPTPPTPEAAPTPPAPDAAPPSAETADAKPS